MKTTNSSGDLEAMTRGPPRWAKIHRSSSPAMESTGSEVRTICGRSKDKGQLRKRQPDFNDGAMVGRQSVQNL